jgi:hypothetical protein
LVPANNLTAPKTINFSVTAPNLGSFSFQDAGPVITAKNLEIGAPVFTLSVKNVGAVNITGFSLTIPNKFTKINDTCAGASPLPVNASCTVGLSVANGAGIDAGTFNILASGDAATVDNNGLILTATVQGAVVTIDQPSIALPNVASTQGMVTFTNNGANTIAWNPSTDINDYVISGANTAGISVVSQGGGNTYCDNGAPVAVNASCVMGIQVDTTANVGNYTLTLALANNLAVAQATTFDITSSLGFFSFNPTAIIIGTYSTTQPQTITLSNTGATSITNVFISLPAVLTI